MARVVLDKSTTKTMADDAGGNACPTRKTREDCSKRADGSACSARRGRRWQMRRRVWREPAGAGAADADGDDNEDETMTSKLREAKSDLSSPEFSALSSKERSAMRKRHSSP